MLNIEDIKKIIPHRPPMLLIDRIDELEPGVRAVAMLSLKEYAGRIMYFGGMDKVKFRRQVVPGDVLRLEVEIIKNKGGFGVGNGAVYVDDEVAASAVITFAIQ